MRALFKAGKSEVIQTLLLQYKKSTIAALTIMPMLVSKKSELMEFMEKAVCEGGEKAE